MITAVDTNVLIDLLAATPGRVEATELALNDAERHGPLVVAPVVYAELAGPFPEPGELDRFLDTWNVEMVPIGRQALWHAGKAWQAYARARPVGFQCPACGHQWSSACPACDARLRTRQHVLADFLIGGHASSHADRLMTRDRGYYRRYFPKLELITP